jgi:hypothetical protein
VNSMHAKAPRWKMFMEPESYFRQKSERCARDLEEIFRSDKLVQWSCPHLGLRSCQDEKAPHDRSPTPSPLITRPMTISTKPVVKVCTAPPIPKTTAPANRVPLLPIMSPICPAAIDVTCMVHQMIRDTWPLKKS